MAASDGQADFGPRAETNLYLKQVRQMTNSLIPANTQRTDSGLMAASQQMKRPRVVAEQQTNTFPRLISMQQKKFDLMLCCNGRQSRWLSLIDKHI